MSDNKLPPLAATGIDGLDRLLRGGLPAHRMHLIEGVPGTGKTTLALQFLLHGRDAGEVGLYVTLSETNDELQAVAMSHGWSLEGISTLQLEDNAGDAADEYTVYHPSEVELGDLTKTIMDRVEKVQPSRVVLDSLSELRLLARDPLRYRRQILALKQFFARRRCTVLILDDHSAGGEDMQLRSLAHGVVLVELEPFPYGRARRRLRIVKVRGMAAVEGFHDFSLVRGGLVVFPQLETTTNGAQRPSNPLRSGSAELDQQLGGGLSWGTTTLFVGPAGAGKSTLAAQYLCAAAHPDARAAVFLFDERRTTYVARCDALGMNASERLASGHLEIEQVEPGVISPGEFADRIRRKVDDEGVRLIGIDTLNGYLNAIPVVETPLVRMHELLSYLNERSVATLMVLAQHGLIGAHMESPLDLSYLADAIIMLRFFEAHGVIRRAVSVMKKRTGHHETSIRELLFKPGSIQLGEPLADFQGVLTGVPQYVGGESPLLRNDRDRR